MLNIRFRSRFIRRHKIFNRLEWSGAVCRAVCFASIRVKLFLVCLRCFSTYFRFNVGTKLWAIEILQEPAINIIKVKHHPLLHHKRPPSKQNRKTFFGVNFTWKLHGKWNKAAFQAARAIVHHKPHNFGIPGWRREDFYCRERKNSEEWIVGARGSNHCTDSSEIESNFTTKTLLSALATETSEQERLLNIDLCFHERKKVSCHRFIRHFNWEGKIKKFNFDFFFFTRREFHFSFFSSISNGKSESKAVKQTFNWTAKRANSSTAPWRSPYSHCSRWNLPFPKNVNDTFCITRRGERKIKKSDGKQKGKVCDVSLF